MGGGDVWCLSLWVLLVYRPQLRTKDSFALKTFVREREMRKPRTPRSKNRQYHKQYTRKALDTRAKERFDKLFDLNNALAWCATNKKGARAAETHGKKTGEFKVSEKEANIAAFEVCEEVCGCVVVPCPWAKWKRCPQCGPKKGLCTNPSIWRAK